MATYNLRMYLHLNRIPHYTTLQKFASRIDGTLLYMIASSFIIDKIRKGGGYSLL